MGRRSDTTSKGEGALGILHISGGEKEDALPLRQQQHSTPCAAVSATLVDSLRPFTGTLVAAVPVAPPRFLHFAEAALALPSFGVPELRSSDCSCSEFGRGHILGGRCGGPKRIAPFC